VCWNILGPMPRNYAYRIEATLGKAITERENLKCAPYFLGKPYEKGLYQVKQNDEKAKEYLAIAAKRGYEPGKLIPMRKQGEEYKLML